MADRYLLESGAPDGYLLEDSSGVLLLEDMPPFSNEIIGTFNVSTRPSPINSIIFVNTLATVLSSAPVDNTTVLRNPLFVNKRVTQDIPTQSPVVNLLETTLAQAAPVQNPFVNEILPTIQAVRNVQTNVVPNLLNTTFTDTYVAVAYPESFPIQPYKQILANTVFPNLLLTTLFTNPRPFVNQISSAPPLTRTLLIDAIGAHPVLYSNPTITGSTNYTNNNDTVSATGTTTVVGTSSTTNNNDTSSAVGTITILGTSSTTNNNDTVSASGSIGSAVSGSANITEGADTSSASGTTTVVGSSSTTNNNDTSSAAGTTTIQGSLAKTNNNDNASAAGYVGNPPTVTTYLPLTGAGK